MAIDPNDICLNQQDKELLAKVADKNGQSWREVFRQAMAKYEHASSPDQEYDLDTEFLEWCAKELEGKEMISHEEARRILDKVPGSMADDIIAQREERL